MNCQNCSKELPETAKFCGFCGEIQNKINTPVHDSGNNTNTVKEKKHGSFIISLITNIVFVIVIILLLIMVFNQSFIIDRRFDDTLFFVEDNNTGKEYSYRLKGGLIENSPNVDDYFLEKFSDLDKQHEIIIEEKKKLEKISNINKELSLSKSKPFVVLGSSTLNTLYVGIDNPLIAKSSGFELKNLQLRTSHGTITKEYNDYSIKLQKVVNGNRISIHSSAKINEENINFKATTFNVKRIPDPIAEIAGQSDGNIKKNTLLAAGAIIPNMGGFEPDCYFIVTSYSFSTLINGDLITKNVKGIFFNSDIQSIIRIGKRKQLFFFRNIRAKGPDGTIRSLNPIILELK